MLVRWEKINRNRIRVVGTGPDVESGESNLVYGLSKMLESLNLCLLTMEMCLTAENYCEAQRKEQMQKALSAMEKAA